MNHAEYKKILGKHRLPFLIVFARTAYTCCSDTSNTQGAMRCGDLQSHRKTKQVILNLPMYFEQMKRPVVLAAMLQSLSAGQVGPKAKETTGAKPSRSAESPAFGLRSRMDLAGYMLFRYV